MSAGSATSMRARPRRPRAASRAASARPSAGHGDRAACRSTGRLFASASGARRARAPPPGRRSPTQPERDAAVAAVERRDVTAQRSPGETRGLRRRPPRARARRTSGSPRRARRACGATSGSPGSRPAGARARAPAAARHDRLRALGSELARAPARAARATVAPPGTRLQVRSTPSKRSVVARLAGDGARGSWRTGRAARPSRSPGSCACCGSRRRARCRSGRAAGRRRRGRRVTRARRRVAPPAAPTSGRRSRAGASPATAATVRSCSGKRAGSAAAANASSARIAEAVWWPCPPPPSVGKRVTIDVRAEACGSPTRRRRGPPRGPRCASVSSGVFE